jgi:hypothetical protein
MGDCHRNHIEVRLGFWVREFLQFIVIDGKEYDC